MPTNRSECEIRIGTSGWHYKHWVGPFYPSKTATSKMLAYYCRHFDTVELNNTFYRLPLVSGLNNWRDSTPPNFVFAAKGSRFLTHMKRLKDPAAGVTKYFARVEILGNKLGPILFQLPPHWQIDKNRFAAFLETLPNYHQYAFEFRNPTWDTEEIYELLRRHNIGYCIFDLAGTQSPVEVTSNFAYIRLHGPGGKYQGSYTDSGLAGWAKRIAGWRSTLHNIYVYFDNDEGGFAAQDALRLKQVLLLQ